MVIIIKSKIFTFKLDYYYLHFQTGGKTEQNLSEPFSGWSAKSDYPLLYYWFATKHFTFVIFIITGIKFYL